MSSTDTICGAPYIIGDSVWVQAGSDRFTLGTVVDRAKLTDGVRFGLHWVLLVDLGTRVERVTCDDNGRNRTLTHGVMPS